MWCMLTSGHNTLPHLMFFSQVYHPFTPKLLPPSHLFSPSFLPLCHRVSWIISRWCMCPSSAFEQNQRNLFFSSWICHPSSDTLSPALPPSFFHLSASLKTGWLRCWLVTPEPKVAPLFLLWWKVLLREGHVPVCVCAWNNASIYLFIR